MSGKCWRPKQTKKASSRVKKDNKHMADKLQHWWQWTKEINKKQNKRSEKKRLPKRGEQKQGTSGNHKGSKLQRRREGAKQRAMLVHWLPKQDLTLEDT